MLQNVALQKRDPALRNTRLGLFIKSHADSYDIGISVHFRPSRFFMTFGPSCGDDR